MMRQISWMLVVALMGALIGISTAVAQDTNPGGLSDADWALLSPEQQALVRIADTLEALDARLGALEAGDDEEVVEEDPLTLEESIVEPFADHEEEANEVRALYEGYSERIASLTRTEAARAAWRVQELIENYFDNDTTMRWSSLRRRVLAVLEDYDLLLPVERADPVIQEFMESVRVVFERPERTYLEGREDEVVAGELREAQAEQAVADAAARREALRAELRGLNLEDLFERFNEAVDDGQVSSARSILAEAEVNEDDYNAAQMAQLNQMRRDMRIIDRAANSAQTQISGDGQAQATRSSFILRFGAYGPVATSAHSPYIAGATLSRDSRGQNTVFTMNGTVLFNMNSSRGWYVGSVYGASGPQYVWEDDDSGIRIHIYDASGSHLRTVDLRDVATAVDNGQGGYNMSISLASVNALFSGSADGRRTYRHTVRLPN